jgi:glucose-6-phosphate 1-dehydrogenase
MKDHDFNGSSRPEPGIIVIFGVTGDLARRELMPALCELRCRNLLPEPCAIVGFARRDWSDDKFPEEMRAAVWESACRLGH